MGEPRALQLAWSKETRGCGVSGIALLLVHKLTRAGPPSVCALLSTHDTLPALPSQSRLPP